jgi:uncharacterized protein YndB with AHSA1/START domain
MAAIVDIIIKTPRLLVWSVIADPMTHVHWLGHERTTTLIGDLIEGAKFFVGENGTTVEGEIIDVRPERFLKVRVDRAPDVFFTTEYHLINIPVGCALRVLVEVYESDESACVFLPDATEEEWQRYLTRLKSYCESGPH